MYIKLASINEILLGLAMGGLGGFFFWLSSSFPAPGSYALFTIGMLAILLSIFLIIFGINLGKFKKWAWSASILILIIVIAFSIMLIRWHLPLIPIPIFSCVGAIICLILLILGSRQIFPIRETTEGLQKIQIEKRISIPWKKILIVATLIIAGAIGYLGYHWYKTSQRPAPLQIPEEPIIQDETANLKIYRNEKYGFEIKYPAEIKEEEILYRENEERGFCSVGEGCYTSLFSIELPYPWEEPPFQKSPFDFNLDLKNYPICYSRFFVQVAEKPPLFSLEELKEKYKKGEYIIIDGVKGLRRNEFKGEPPGGGGNEDVVYLPKNSKLYLMRFIIDREILGSKENAEGCVKEQTRIFNQMLSTFKFIKVEETAIVPLVEERPTQACLEVIKNGDPSSKINVVFIGDKYSSNEMDLFRSDVDKFIDKEGTHRGLLSIEPFKSYQSHFNFYRIDKPYKFGCEEWTYGLAKEGICSVSGIRSTAKMECPNLDELVVLLNYYEKGSQFNWAVSHFCVTQRMHGSYIEKPLGYEKYEFSAQASFVHEFGHSFGDLADEYTNMNTGSRLDRVNCDVAGCPKWCSGEIDTSKPCYELIVEFENCVNKGSSSQECFEAIEKKPGGSGIDACDIGVNCLEGTGCVWNCKGTDGYKPSSPDGPNRPEGWQEIPCKMLDSEYDVFCPVCQRHLIEVIENYKE